MASLIAIHFIHSTLEKIYQVDKMGRRENEEGKVGKARSCLLANTRITVRHTEKI